MNLSPRNLARWSGGSWDPHPPRTIRWVTQDTRQLGAGDLYVALCGERFDGHAFVDQARRLGAAGAMVSAAWTGCTTDDWPLLKVNDPLTALGAMAAEYRADWPARIVGITGSVGKTTVKDMVAHLLRGAVGDDGVAATRANWNNAIGLPLSLLNASPACPFGVFEIGTNHPGEIGVLARMLHPDLGVITTVGEAHLEHFGDMAAIAHEKADLLRVLPAAGVAVVNRDHAYVDILRDAAVCRMVEVSLDASAPAAYRLRGMDSDRAAGIEITIEDVAAQSLERVSAPVWGRHQAGNVLLAAATVREMGVAWEVIRAAARSFEMPAMRWQPIEARGITLINDAYNANPLSMRAALEAFGEDWAPAGHRWLVLGGMRELGESAVAAHRAIGRQVAAGNWRGLVTVGDLAMDIAAGAREAGFADDAVWECETAVDAATVLRPRLQAGDAVLVKASRGLALETVIPRLQEKE